MRQTRFKLPYFNRLDLFLEKHNFKPTLLPWRYENSAYAICQVEDSDGNEDINPSIYTISLKALDETVYRGRLANSDLADFIFCQVVENRYFSIDGVITLPIERLEEKYTYADLKEAYQEGQMSERYEYEYLANGSPIPNFESWYKETFNSDENRKDETRDKSIRRG